MEAGVRRFVPVVDRPGVRDGRARSRRIVIHVQSKRAIENIRRDCAGVDCLGSPVQGKGAEPAESTARGDHRARSELGFKGGARPKMCAVWILPACAMRLVGARSQPMVANRGRHGSRHRAIDRHLSPLRRQSTCDLGTGAIIVPEQLGPFLGILFGKDRQNTFP